MSLQFANVRSFAVKAGCESCERIFLLVFIARVARLAFLTPILTNLAFLIKGSWHQKNCLALWLFWRQLEHTIRLMFRLFKYLPEKCYQAFLDSTWCIFSNVMWQPIKE